MPSISVALATFNGEKHLEPQLRSLAAQSRRPTELVVVDDGSADATKTVVNDFAKTAPFPVRLHDNQCRSGYRRSFMRAAELCASDLIAFCDQDDVWEPAKLAAMEQVFSDPGVLLAYHNATVTAEDGSPLGTLYRVAAESRRLTPLTENPWRLAKGFTQVFRRDLLRFSSLHAASVDPYWPDTCLAHDQWFLLLASVLGEVVRMPQPLAHYRQHHDNEHGWASRSRLEPRPHYLLNNGFIAAAKNRVKLLTRLEELVEPQQRGLVHNSIAYYQELYRRLDERHSIYESGSMIERARTVHALLKRGAYRNTAHAPGFGWFGLVMDCYLGLALGPASKRLL